MNGKLHPHALIMGVGIGIMVWAAIRHPLFAIFAAVIAVILLDMAYKSHNNKSQDK